MTMNTANTMKQENKLCSVFCCKLCRNPIRFLHLTPQLVQFLFFGLSVLEVSRGRNRNIFFAFVDLFESLTEVVDANFRNGFPFRDIIMLEQQ